MLVWLWEKFHLECLRREDREDQEGLKCLSEALNLSPNGGHGAGVCGPGRCVLSSSSLSSGIHSACAYYGQPPFCVFRYGSAAGNRPDEVSALCACSGGRDGSHTQPKQASGSTGRRGKLGKEVAGDGGMALCSEGLFER